MKLRPMKKWKSKSIIETWLTHQLHFLKIETLFTWRNETTCGPCSPLSSPRHHNCQVWCLPELAFDCQVGAQWLTSGVKSAEVFYWLKTQSPTQEKPSSLHHRSCVVYPMPHVRVGMRWAGWTTQMCELMTQHAHIYILKSSDHRILPSWCLWLQLIISGFSFECMIIN